MKLIFSILITIIFLNPLFAEEIYKDSFPNGKPQLKWNFFPFFNLDNLEGVYDPSAPDRDNGIGVLKNSNVGGFASLSYAVTEEVENFYLESYIYCPLTEGTKGPLIGLAFLIDPIKGNFYRVVCDFKTSEPSINLAYVGNDKRNFPVFLRIWRQNEIPGGIPKKEGWHKLGIRVKDGKAIIYWNGKRLNLTPVSVDRIKRGFVGVYANYVGGFGLVTTKVDSFMLKKE
jgi:hypothetical protein